MINVNELHIIYSFIRTNQSSLDISLNLVFDMGSSLTCSNDYVEFLEANESGELTSVRKYCGEDDPQVYVSTLSKVQVHYKKTVNFSGTGWQLQFMGVLEGRFLLLQEIVTIEYSC